MKPQPGLKLKMDSLYRRMLAHAFRITGQRLFVRAYRRKRNLLLGLEEMFILADWLRWHGGPLLVFGAGNDSLFWSALNAGRATIFLENDAAWLEEIRTQSPSLRIYPVIYTSSMSDIAAIASGEIRPKSLELSSEVRREPWKTVIVDAPLGWGDGPGRSQSIYEASRLVAPGGRIFLHDCDRDGEKLLAGRLLSSFTCQRLGPRLWAFDREA
jgi:hypothetical protein